MDYSSATLAVPTCRDCKPLLLSRSYKLTLGAICRNAPCVTHLRIANRQHSIHQEDIQRTFKPGNAVRLQSFEEVRWRCALNEAWYNFFWLSAHNSRISADSHNRVMSLVMKWRAHLAI